MPIVILCTDFGDSRSNARVRYELYRQLGLETRIIAPDILPLNTVHAGYCAYEFGLIADPIPDTILIVNACPRGEQAGPCANNNLEPMVYGRLETGVHLLAFNAGHTLSWVRPHLRQLFEVEYLHDGSQFRTCVSIPPVARAIATGELFAPDRRMLPRLSRQIDPADAAVIPPPPAGPVVLEVDGTDNIKTSVHQTQVTCPLGSKVLVRFGDHPEVTCTCRPGMFEDSQDEWVFAPGSSGPKGDRLMEVSFRRKPFSTVGAAGIIGGVQPGCPVYLEPLG